RRLGGIGWAEHVANLAHGVYALINNGDRFFSSRSVAFFGRTFAGFSSGHEFDDAFPIFAAAVWAEFLLQNAQHRSVKLLRLFDTHLVNFESDDGEPRARKHLDHAARSQIRKPEIVGLDQDKSLFYLRVGGKGDDSIQDSTVRIRKFRPEFQIPFDRLRIERRQYSRLEVSHLA